MSTFERVRLGETIAGPTREVPRDAVDVVRGLGGYTHPLFNDEEYARGAGFDRIPLPGELVLFLLGGMAEQCDVFDDSTVALLGIDAVKFASAVYPGDTIRLDMEVAGKRRSASGSHGSVRFLWRCTNGDGDEVLTAEAELLFRLPTRGAVPTPE